MADMLFSLVAIVYALTIKAAVPFGAALGGAVVGAMASFYFNRTIENDRRKRDVETRRQALLFETLDRTGEGIVRLTFTLIKLRANLALLPGLMSDRTRLVSRGRWDRNDLAPTPDAGPEQIARLENIAINRAQYDIAKESAQLVDPVHEAVEVCMSWSMQRWVLAQPLQAELVAQIMEAGDIGSDCHGALTGMLGEWPLVCAPLTEKVGSLTGRITVCNTKLMAICDQLQRVALTAY